MRDNGGFMDGMVVEMKAQQFKMQSVFQPLNNAFRAFSHSNFTGTFLELKILFVCLCQYK